MAILSDFDYGLTLHETQHLAVGQSVVDPQGNRWGYVQIGEATGSPHRVLRSKVHADIMSAGNGVVNAAQTVGSRRLTVASTTNRDFRSSYGPFVGARGVISEGGGVGQRFTVVRVLSATEVEVDVHGSSNGGWITALTTSSRFYLWFPGQAMQGDGIADIVEGICHCQAAAADVGKFTYVQRSGVSLVRVDNSGNDIGAETPIIPTAAGLVQGITAGSSTYDSTEIANAASEGASVIGRSIQNIAGSNDDPMLCMINIPDAGISAKLAHMNNTFNTINIGTN